MLKNKFRYKVPDLSLMKTLRYFWMQTIHHCVTDEKNLHSRNRLVEATCYIYRFELIWHYTYYYLK